MGNALATRPLLIRDSLQPQPPQTVMLDLANQQPAVVVAGRGSRFPAPAEPAQTSCFLKTVSKLQLTTRETHTIPRTNSLQITGAGKTAVAIAGVGDTTGAAVTSTAIR